MPPRPPFGSPYYILRFGYRPSKVAFLARHAWRTEYNLPAIKRWLSVFLERFFETSQFKRSAMPNAPKVGSGGSLSPRGDWRAPSDSTATAWLRELNENVPDAVRTDAAGFSEWEQAVPPRDS